MGVPMQLVGPVGLQQVSMGDREGTLSRTVIAFLFTADITEFYLQRVRQERSTALATYSKVVYGWDAGEIVHRVLRGNGAEVMTQSHACTYQVTGKGKKKEQKYD